MLDMEKVSKDLIEWIREQLEVTGGNKIILGISGGKDSSVVAALAAKAIGPENVLVMADVVVGNPNSAQEAGHSGIDKVPCPLDAIGTATPHLAPVDSPLDRKSTRLNSSH